MQHRHLNHESYTPAAVDDVIARGKWADWADLRRAMFSDASLRAVVETICVRHAADPQAQRHQFWAHYVKGPQGWRPTHPATRRFTHLHLALEAAAENETGGYRRPRLASGSLDGIETGIRQLIRREPLETEEREVLGEIVTVPTESEILRIKGALILNRNATRDYLYFEALARNMGDAASASALRNIDRLYPQANGESPLQQLLAQLASPRPYDLAEANLVEHKGLAARWRTWAAVEAVCAPIATTIFDLVRGKPRPSGRGRIARTP